MEKPCEGRVRLFCNQCNAPVYENPVPATCVIVPDKTNRILLVKRTVEPKIGYWCLPGGFMELGEQPGQSALRELQEETGLSAKIDRLLGVTSSYSDQYDTVLMIGYLIKEQAGILQAGDDASDAAYFAIENLPDIAFESHKKFLSDYSLNPEQIPSPTQNIK